MNEPHPRMNPQPAAQPPPPALPYREPPEQKVGFRDVMPRQELAELEAPPEPTLAELIAEELKNDDRRTTDFSWLLK